MARANVFWQNLSRSALCAGPFKRHTTHDWPPTTVSKPTLTRSLLNLFALNIHSEVCDNLEPQYDEGIVEMTRWLEGDEAAKEEQLALQD